MPSWTVPMLSNNCATSQMIHCDMARSRITRPSATVIAPTVIDARLQA